MTKTFEYEYQGKTYQVNVTYKNSHRISYHFRNGQIIIYCPYLTSIKTIRDGLDRFAYKLIDQNATAQGWGEGYVYLLGNKINISYPGRIMFSDSSFISFKTKEELERKLKKWFLQVVTSRTRYYESLMKTGTNNVRVRKMTTRYGSNACHNKSITYSTMIMHFSLEIIDAIVIHELAHCFVSGHQKKFYDVVYKYCPNYDTLHRKLRKGEFK